MDRIPLTKGQLAELQWLQEEASAQLNKVDPKIAYMLAGMTLSNGGAEKIHDLLGTCFERLQKAASEMPGTFHPDVSPDTVLNLQGAAMMYLTIDKARHKPGWILSAKKRAEALLYQEEMDHRAWLAAESLKLARSYLQRL